MRNLLLGFAAPLAVSLVPPAPVHAQDWAASSFTSSQGLRSGQFGNPPTPGDLSACRNLGRERGRHHHGSSGCDVLVGGWGYVDGEWARYNNRSWDPDSYNDWWHDRPDRAFPRWVWSNQDCARRWWSGGGFHC
jgi:hypothetical protein